MDTPNASIPAALRPIQLRGGRMAGEVRFKSRGRINLMGSWEAAVSSSEPREHGSSDTTECGSLLDRISWCAVQRHGLPVGANPTRQLSLQPVAIGAAVEVIRVASRNFLTICLMRILTF